LIFLFICVNITDFGLARNKSDKNKNNTSLNKPTIPNAFNSTTANVWTRLTNWGFIGKPNFSEPTFEWPGGSGNHYLYQGSIWIAGIDPTGNIHCTAGDEEEFNRTIDTDDIVRLWSDSDTLFLSRPNVNPSFTGKQVSAEDTYAEYTDLDPQWHISGDSPLGIKVIEHTYKWNAAYNENFIIFDYQVINIGLDNDGDLLPDTSQNLSGVYIAIRFDADISYAAGGDWHLDDLTAYYIPKQLSYLYDGDDPQVPGNDTGENGLSEGYIYARLLKAAGGTPFVSYTNPVSHSWWTISDDPKSEKSKYAYMSTPNYAGIPASPYDYRFLQTAGPFEMEPGDTVNIVWATGVGLGLEGIIGDSDWAKLIFDAGYLAATAPEPPNLTTEKGDGYIKLMWDHLAEESIDPLTGEKDFEGYRLYKSRQLDNLGNKIWIKLADFDKINELGANSGLQYEYIDNDVLKGYSYTFAVTSYDKGAPEVDLPKLESSRREDKSSTKLIISAPVKNTVDEVYVYPNPYIGSVKWDHVFTLDEPFTRKLVFANLPDGKITISIFTLDGDLVDTIEQDNGESIATWDMITRNNRELVSGIYLYTVESEVGKFIGRFVVIQ